MNINAMRRFHLIGRLEAIACFLLCLSGCQPSEKFEEPNSVAAQTKPKPSTAVRESPGSKITEPKKDDAPHPGSARDEPKAMKQAHLLAFAPVTDASHKVVVNVITIRLPMPEGIVWNEDPLYILQGDTRGRAPPWEEWQQSQIRAVIEKEVYLSGYRQRVAIDDKSGKVPLLGMYRATHYDVSFAIPSNVALAGKSIEIFDDASNWDRESRDKKPSYVLKPTSQALKKVSESLRCSLVEMPNTHPERGPAPQIQISISRALRVEKLRLGEFEGGLAPPRPSGAAVSLVKDVTTSASSRFSCRTSRPESFRKGDQLFIKLHGLDSWIRCDGRAK